MNQIIRKYHRSIQMIPKQLICRICLQLVQKPVTCVKCFLVYCRKCYKILNKCSFIFCTSTTVRQASIAHRIFLREIQVQCSICKIYICAQNYTKHIQLCEKHYYQKQQNQQQELILQLRQNQSILQQIDCFLQNSNPNWKNNEDDLFLQSQFISSEQTIENIKKLALSCSLCEQNFNQFGIEEHIQTCLETLIKCDNKRCNWIGKRRDFDEHHLPCTKWMLKKYKYLPEIFSTYRNLIKFQQKQAIAEERKILDSIEKFRFSEIYPHDFDTSNSQLNEQII